MNEAVVFWFGFGFLVLLFGVLLDMAFSVED